MSVSHGWALPEYMIDNFDTVQSGTDGTGSEPFIVHSERYGRLDLTYNQPDGNRDLAWWEALSWSWQPVDVSAYNYMLLDVRGGGGGEDFTVEFHYNDGSGDSHKPWIRISDYGEVSPTWKTFSIPIEDFRDFQKVRATALAVGFRYITDGPESVALDNIGLSAYPASFFWTHSAASVDTNAAQFIFKAHHPEGDGPCSNVTLYYSINSSATSDVTMSYASSGWVHTVTGLADEAQVDYAFSYDCTTGGVTETFQLIHNAVIDHVAPSVPTGLSGLAMSPTRIDLSWSAATDNVAVAGYRIYRNNVEIDTTTNTAYSSVGLNQNREYDYYIRAYDAFDNWSDKSDTVSVTTPEDVTDPSMPLGFTGEVTSAATVWLEWQPATDDVGVRGYYILRDGVDHGVSFSNSATVSGVPGSNHVFAVQAYDDADNRSPTSSLLAVTMPMDMWPPTVPSNLTATAVSPARIDLSWAASSDDGYIEGYEIFMDGSYFDTTIETNYSVHGLAAETTYRFTVRAYDSAGRSSSHSAEAVAVTPTGAVEQLGSYAASIPAGCPVTSSNQFITDNLSVPLPTHDWWTSIMTVRHSGMVSAKPLAFYTKGWQLECGYPPVNAYSDRIEAPFTKELCLAGLAGSFPDKPDGYARVDGYGDFSVRTRLGEPYAHLMVTLVQGSPYVYVTESNCPPVLTCPLGYTLVDVDPAASYLVIRVSDAVNTTYALFAPAGTTWDTTSPDEIIPEMPADQHFMSIAVMTDRSSSFDTNEFNLLQQHAYVFVTNTHVDFAYEPSQGRVTATYRCDTEVMQGGETQTLMGLLPLHWKNTEDETVTNMSYSTILGNLKIHAGNAWTMALRFGGIVPRFPEPTDAGWSAAEFETLVQAMDEFNGGISQTYWYGLEMGRVARAILALDAAGMWEERDDLVSQLRTGLVDVYTYTIGETDHFFAYDDTWGSMVGFGESFNAVSYLNDHHFHYGYYVYAAAIVAMYDPSFADEYKDIVDRVIRDYNNPSRDVSGPDPLPWLRHFDPWQGHCWATGLPTGESGASDERLYPEEKPVSSQWGPDQESTSEAMNSWAAMFLWGLVTRNQEFIDMGAVGYAVEAGAIREYWYDADQSNWPAGYPKTMICRVFGGKADADTWFDSTMDAVWGIEYVPVGPHMTYMGDFIDYRITDYNYFKAQFGTGAVRDGWKDVHWMYRSFFEPETVLAEYDSSLDCGSDNSQAAIYYMLHAMNSFGRVDTSVYSDCPSLVALTGDGRTNYVAFNYSGTTLTAGVYRVSDDARIGSVILSNQRTTFVPTDEDADGDGLGNAMEMSLGTDLFLRDSDGDGQYDNEEFYAGTDAMDPSSLFEVDTMALADGAGWRLQWPGCTARTYRVTAYPSVMDMMANSNGDVLAEGITGTGWMNRVVSPQDWTTGMMRIIVTPDP
jgi:endoglucanase Acf2/fibronectin type 3 domain-containing protein